MPVVKDAKGSEQPHQAIASGNAVASDNKTHAPWEHAPSCDLSALDGAHAPMAHMQHFQLMTTQLGAASMHQSMQHAMPAGGNGNDFKDCAPSSMLSAGSKHASLQLQQRSTRTTKDTGGIVSSQKRTSSEIATPAHASAKAVPDAPERFSDKPVNQEVVSSDDASAANALLERPHTAGSRDRRLAMCLDYLAGKLPTSTAISAQDELLSGAPRGRRDAFCLDYSMPAAARNRRNTVCDAGSVEASDVAVIEEQE